MRAEPVTKKVQQPINLRILLVPASHVLLTRLLTGLEMTSCSLSPPSPLVCDGHSASDRDQKFRVAILGGGPAGVGVRSAEYKQNPNVDFFFQVLIRAARLGLLESLLGNGRSVADDGKFSPGQPVGATNGMCLVPNC